MKQIILAGGYRNGRIEQVQDHTVEFHVDRVAVGVLDLPVFKKDVYKESTEVVNGNVVFKYEG